ncbi:hypothetical protein RHGRI_018518 [Rhododendron griersonianum]|uniref:Uncharacterized protein n=1 Tax=Rhododendron griersonianum TaxID=479676 RepID=A0AAV6K1V4_9ERIC|nr:hypothetical protein RHGRI_018518 [Rhododendron griersonianum]
MASTSIPTVLLTASTTLVSVTQRRPESVFHLKFGEIIFLPTLLLTCNATIEELVLFHDAIQRILLATESHNRIEGKIQLIVDGIKYTVRVEEEGTFRVVASSEHATNSEAGEDDEVDNIDDDKDASRMEKEQRNEAIDDIEIQRNMEAEKGDNSVINGGNQQTDQLENLSNQKCVLDQEGVEFVALLIKANEDVCDESSNSVHGLIGLICPGLSNPNPRILPQICSL